MLQRFSCLLALHIRATAVGTPAVQAFAKLLHHHAQLRTLLYAAGMSQTDNVHRVVKATRRQLAVYPTGLPLLRNII
jgi:hypothetical protein